MNVWAVSDAQLKRLLDNFRLQNYSATYHLALYQNDYTPGPTTSGGNFIWSSFPGYVTQDFLIRDFPPASVTSNVAMLTLNHAIEFNASTTGTFSQPCYGYAVFDDSWNYAWSERFADMLTIVPGFQVKITPRYKQAVCAASSSASRRRTRAVAGS